MGEMADTEAPPAQTDYPSRPLTVEDYHRLGEAGIFEPQERVELLDGLLIAMAPIGNARAYAVRRLSSAFFERFSGRATVDVQNPLRLDPQSEPQPDLMLLAARDDWYRAAIPRPSDVLLVVEVADASLQYDRGRKLRAYASGGVREVWIVDLTRGRLESHTDARAGTYATQTACERGDCIAPAAFPNDTIALDDFLP